MKLKEFTDYLSKARYTVYRGMDNKSYSIFSRRLFLGGFQPDRGSIIFWTNDNRILPARDFMLDGLDTFEMRIFKPYMHIVIIKGFKHV